MPLSDTLGCTTLLALMLLTSLKSFTAPLEQMLGRATSLVLMLLTTQNSFAAPLEGPMLGCAMSLALMLLTTQNFCRRGVASFLFVIQGIQRH